MGQKISDLMCKMMSNPVAEPFSLGGEIKFLRPDVPLAPIQLLRVGRRPFSELRDRAQDSKRAAERELGWYTKTNSSAGRLGSSADN